MSLIKASEETRKQACKTEYALVAFLLLMSGSPALSYPVLYAIIGLFMLLVSLWNHSLHRRMGLIWYVVMLMIIFALQFIVLEKISFFANLGVISKIVFGSTVMWILKDRFKKVYLDCIYFFASISLVFYALNLVGYDVPALFPAISRRVHCILLYNQIIGVCRNCGPFWEPGAYACYLLLVPLFYVGSLNNLIKDERKKTLVLLVALLTTLSTTGYVALFFLVMYYFVFIKKRVGLGTYIATLVFGILAVYVGSKLDFIGDKVEHQLNVTAQSKGEYNSNRFGAFAFDLHYIKKHPIVGNGFIVETRYADHPQLWYAQLGHGNGFCNYCAQMGLIAMFAYLYMLYRESFSSPRTAIARVVIVILLLQGEQLLNYPLFLSLPFIKSK